MSAIIKIVLTTLTFLLPLFFWTLTPNFFATSKEFIVLISTIVLLSSMTIKYIQNKPLKSTYNQLTIPLLVFFGSIVGSLIANPEGRPEALASKGLILLLLPIFAYLVSLSHNRHGLIKNIITACLGSSTVLSLHSLLSLTFLSKSHFLPTYMQTITFTPTGSYLTTLIFIVIGLSLSVYLFKHTSQTIKSIAAGLMILHTIAIVAIVSLMLPGSALFPSTIPLQASWSIALDALKSLRSLLFGIGISNYSLLYSAVKPISLNMSENWNTIQSSTSSELLTLLPTAGLIPTLSLIYLMIKGIVWSKNTDLFTPFILICLSIILFPTSIVLYALFFTILALSVPTMVSDQASASNFSSRLIALFFGLITIALIYLSSSNYLSEFYMRLSQNSIDAGDSKSAYSYHLQALRFSPKITNYHLSFSELNFRLATALSQKPDLNDTDREAITGLVQQSIQSGKTAIELRPNYSSTWVTVAKIYQNLINVADGADKFAIDAYLKSISLDRANPLLRLDFGNLLVQLAEMEKASDKKNELRARAKTEFQTAIQLKSNYANAYYNLAKLYETDGNYNDAVLAMQQVLKYLDPSSNDYSQAQANLETLKAKAPKQTPSPSSTPSLSTETDKPTMIATPTPLPSPLPGGNIEIPANEL